MSEQSYIDYFSILKLDGDCKSGDVRKSYKQLMKDLVFSIAREEITEEKRDRYLLDMARLNAAYYILRDADRRAAYIEARSAVISLEAEWRQAVEQVLDTMDGLRRGYDAALRHFLSTYMEELMMEAGRDKECVENSNWDMAHERHAGRVLRHYRQRLYHEIHERLPYYDVTEPRIDWQERSTVVASFLEQEVA